MPNTVAAPNFDFLPLVFGAVIGATAAATIVTYVLRRKPAHP